MAYSLAAQYLSTLTTGVATATATHTVGSSNGAFLAIMYQQTGGALTISSVTNQASTSVSFTESSTSNFNGASGFGQRLIWVPRFPAGTTSYTVTFGAVAQAMYFQASEYTGLANTLTIDAQSAFDTASAAGGANDVTSGTATPTGVVAVGGAILFGFSGSYSAFESCTAGTGFGNYVAMNPNNGVQGAGAIADKRITTNAAVAAIFSSATTGNEYYTQMLIVDEPSSPPNLLGQICL